MNWTEKSNTKEKAVSKKQGELIKDTDKPGTGSSDKKSLNSKTKSKKGSK